MYSHNRVLWSSSLSEESDCTLARSSILHTYDKTVDHHEFIELFRKYANLSAGRWVSRGDTSCWERMLNVLKAHESIWNPLLSVILRFSPFIVYSIWFGIFRIKKKRIIWREQEIANLPTYQNKNCSRIVRNSTQLSPELIMNKKLFLSHRFRKASVIVERVLLLNDAFNAISAGDKRRFFQCTKSFHKSACCPPCPLL